MTSGESTSFQKLPPASKYHSDLHYLTPSMLVSIYDNLLYHTIDREPLINVFDLEGDQELIESIPLQATKFIEEEGRKDPQGPMPRVYFGNVRALYPFEDGVVVYYNEGIDEDTFLNNGLGERENFILYPYFDKRILKIHHASTGWSNEIAVPAEVRFFLNIASPEEDIYALRNDDVVGEEQDFVTIYKMRLVNLRK